MAAWLCTWDRDVQQELLPILVERAQEEQQWQEGEEQQ